MSNYSIKDLEHLTGVKAHTIRIWEQRYEIITPKRSDTNIRYYTDDDLKHMINVSLLNNNGFKISKIAKFTAEEINQEVYKVLDVNDNYQDQISALTMCMLEFDEAHFEKIISSNILKKGFESTMVNIILPFMMRIGVLWLTGAVSPAQEHFISNLIRQKLIVAIDAQITSSVPDKPSFMLFLPEGELHEISLLFASYVIRARGFKVIYLGQSLPLHEVKDVYKGCKSEYLLTVMTSLTQINDVQKYLDQISSSFPESKILITGRQVVGNDFKLGENMEVLVSMPYFLSLMDSIVAETATV
ncbi:MerR family transcriptional regulator [Flammeovirga kamogawensis]|uniref:MerR family transcriptional regulator n=1 Tax=Flammeovirga kamogawensis TaxID=373891 RepID=A0ABX8GUB7_9BACT|nr:MerR family transcriptional regulator [Flammeovirga kamogawensis]MBB6459943.1 DNA-binding transcriptional MerR regulator [Flammeovirga kamogawensis]QWG07004.1 MerR family transcriptional regulator [Flammeovirga kamogawensis]TRX68825.1 MerR family transcriptional regulator [Flammeovirga kamogawensis]